MKSRNEMLAAFIKDLEATPVCEDRTRATELVWRHIRALQLSGLASSSQATCSRHDVQQGVEQFCDEGDGEVFHNDPACPSPAA